MSEQYKPSVSEIVDEMLKDVSQYLKENFRKASNKSKETGQYFLEMTKIITLSPYVLPSAAKNVKDPVITNEEDHFDRTHYVGYLSGLFAGLTIDIGQIIGYGYAIHHDHPEVLAIPVVTNIISAVYEKAKSTKEKLLARYEAQTLDSVIEGTEE